MRETSARLLALLSLLQARRDRSGGELAERLAVSPRTVRRDVDRLRGLGYAVRAVKGPDGGYRLAAGTELPPLLFDDEQAVAVAIALRTATTTVAGLDEAAARALATVRQVMPVRLRHRLDTLQVTAVGRTGTRPSPQVDAEVLLALGAAVRDREVLRFDYADSDRAGSPGSRPAAGPPRRAEPHHLVTWSGRWYLVAWDLDRSDWRTFRVDRLTPRTPTGPRFAPRALPDGDDVTAFVTGRLARYDGPGHWPCRGEVLLDVPAATIARWIPAGAVLAEVGPDRSRLVLGSWSWAGMAATLGTFDADIEVVGPPELVAACARLSRRYARAAGAAP